MASQTAAMQSAQKQAFIRDRRSGGALWQTWPKRCQMSGGGDAPALGADRAEGVLPRDLVHDDELIILLLRPSVLYIVLAPLAGLMAILIVTLSLALLASSINWIVWTEEQAYSLGAVAIALRLAWQALDWFNRIYVLTDRRIITRSGVLRVTVFQTRLKSIQHTSVFQRIRERAFGLGSIGFATAGSDVFDTFWLMLRNPFSVHRTIVETIKRYGGSP